MYYKESRITDAASPNRKKILAGLGLLRFFTVFFIAFLLLGPLVKRYFSEIEKPILVFLQDNSESIAHTIDSVEYTTQIEQLKSNLEEKYEVRTYAFGAEVEEVRQFKFNNKATDIAQALNYIQNAYQNQHLGAIVLATDGLYNKGANPLYQTNINVPIYTVAIGDTMPQTDLLIEKVFHNSIAYLGDKLNIKVDISANNLEGSRSKIIIQQIAGQDTKAVFEKQFQIKDNNFTQTFTTIIDAGKTGVQHYRVALAPVAGEAVTANNQQDFYIDVLESRQKILIAANTPHPDIAAIQKAAANNKNYEIEVQFADKLPAEPKAYSLIIFHQLPSVKNPASAFIRQTKEAKVPHWYILGGQTAISRFNAVQNILKINNNLNNIEEVQAGINPDFALYNLEENIQNNIAQLPPLLAPFGTYQTTGAANIHLYQKIGAVATDKPLLLFSASFGERTAILAGEGLWRWYLHDYRKNKSHETFEALVSKIIQYLAVKEDKRQFRVILPEKTFNQNEPVKMRAELYNESYELTNEREVNIAIANEKGEQYEFSFQRAENKTYTLNAGSFPGGSYQFTASTRLNNKRHTYSGKFVVQAVNLEQLATTANHRLLYQISRNAGGALFYPGQMGALAGELQNKSEIKPLLHENYTAKALINIKWLFFLLLIFLGTEWGVRRWSGGY